MADIITIDNETGDDVLSMEEIVNATNLVDIIDKNDAMDMGRRCNLQYQLDDDSRSEWIEAYEKGMDMALQKKKAKSYPFENASNVIYPLITTASIQFASRAYPGIFPGREIVKAKVIGDDSGIVQVDPNNLQAPPQVVVPQGAKAERAHRVASFMSWQLNEQMENWETDTDKMLHNLPIAGCAFRKVWWDNGPQSTFISAKDLVVNMDAKSIEEAPQLSEVFELYPHQILERSLSGLWSEDVVKMFLTEDSIEAFDFVEAHCRYDLDGDGYPEPYIVTFRIGDTSPVRIVANFGEKDVQEAFQKQTLIKATTYYIKYDFIPNPDGGFYGIGFGWLLGPINASVNTAINQLNDAAHWQNSKSGFIGKRLKLQKGNMRFKPGEWKQVDSFGETIKNELVPLDFGGPSPTTFNLLSLMIDAGQNISSVNDIMMGSSEKNLAPTTALTMVEQGTKQFTATYKRIHRALKAEMRLLFKMNAEHVEEITPLYMEIMDDDLASPEDFALDMNIAPITDPDMVTQAMAMAKADYIMSLADKGLVDRQEATQRSLVAANVSEPAKLALKESPPDPEVMIKMAKLENDKARIAITLDKTHAEILKLQTAAIKDLADAEAAEEGIQINKYQNDLKALEMLGNEFRELRGLATESANAGAVQGAPNVPNGQGQ